MPQYQITDSQSGRTVTVEGDSPPTDQESDQIFANLKTAAPTPAPETMGQKAVRIGKEVAGMGINMAGTTLGAAVGGGAGTLLEPGGGTLVGGMAGAAAGNALAQKTNQYLGLQGDFSKGQVAASMLTAGMPGASLAEAGAGQIATAAAKSAAGNYLASAAQTTIDEGHLPNSTQALIAAGGGVMGTGLSKALDTGAMGASIARARALGSVEDATNAQGKAAGYVIPPYETNPSGLNKTLGSVGGKAALKQQAVATNQAVTNALAAKEIGLSPNTAITPEAIQAVQDAAYAPYQRIAQISESSAQDLAALKAQQAQGSGPQYLPAQPGSPHDAAIAANDPLYSQLAGHLETVSGADIQALRQARMDAKNNWNAFARQGDPKFQQAAEKAGETVDALDQKVQDAATAIGDPQLVSDLKQARTLLAKTHVVEGALNTATGDISALKLGALYQKGIPLTGNLQTIGAFAKANPQFVSEAAKNPTAGVSKLAPVAAIAAGALAGGESHSGLAGLAAGVAAHAAPGVARSVLLSPTYQSGMLSAFSRPSYGVAPPDMSAVLARFAAMKATQPDQIPSYLTSGAPGSP